MEYLGAINIYSYLFILALFFFSGVFPDLHIFATDSIPVSEVSLLPWLSESFVVE